MLIYRVRQNFGQNNELIIDYFFSRFSFRLSDMFKILNIFKFYIFVNLNYKFKIFWLSKNYFLRIRDIF